MKKTIALLCAVLMLLLTACNSTSVTETTPPTETTTQIETTIPADGGEDTPEAKEPIDTMEKLARVEGVLSVTQLEFSNPTPDAVAYKLLYETENGKLHANVVLPEDYDNPDKQYPVLIYMPDVTAAIDTLALNYAMRDIIVVRPYRRGRGESEGVRDTGGPKDLLDAQTLLHIIDSATFIQKSNIYVAGAVEFSINALRLFAEDSAHRISGCAVSDPITDIQAYSKHMGISDNVDPEYHELRSAICFAEKLDRPILMVRHTQLNLPAEQSEGLLALLEENICTYKPIDKFGSDFDYEGGHEYLVSWIHEQEQKENFEIEENGRYYIVQTKWMLFYFLKQEYHREEILNIVTEAVSVMADVRNYLGVNYTLEDAKILTCYFDSTYRYNNTDKSSFVFGKQRLNCRSLLVFVHEYVHAVSYSNTDCLYIPTGIFSEGLAQYICMEFYQNIASQEYVYFGEWPVDVLQNEAEHQMFCDLLSRNGFAYNAVNYNKAWVAHVEKYYSHIEINKSNDFYRYQQGAVFVDYCINQLGGMNKFMRAFNDSVQFEKIYGKSAEEILNEALAYNMSLFYPNN